MADVGDLSNFLEFRRMAGSLVVMLRIGLLMMSGLSSSTLVFVSPSEYGLNERSTSLGSGLRDDCELMSSSSSSNRPRSGLAGRLGGPACAFLGVAAGVGGASDKCERCEDIECKDVTEARALLPRLSQLSRGTMGGG